MTDKARPTIWLVDVASGQQRPLEAGSGSYFSPRWSPDGTPPGLCRRGGRRSAAVRPLDGERDKTRASPAFPTARTRSPGRPTAAASLIRCSFPTRACTLGSAPPKPEGAKWADPLEIINAVTYRFDGAGYFKPGYTPDLLGRRPTAARRRQLTFGAINAGGGQIAWTPDSRSVLFSADLDKNWERELNESEIYRVGIDGGAPVALTSRKGPDGSPAVSPDGRLIAYVGADDDGRWLPATPSCR